MLPSDSKPRLPVLHTLACIELDGANKPGMKTVCGQILHVVHFVDVPWLGEYEPCQRCSECLVERGQLGYDATKTWDPPPRR